MFMTIAENNMEDQYKALEIAINSDPLLNEAQRNALHYVRRLCESKEQESCSYIQKALPGDDIAAVIRCSEH